MGAPAGLTYIQPCYMTCRYERSGHHDAFIRSKHCTQTLIRVRTASPHMHAQTFGKDHGHTM